MKKSKKHYCCERCQAYWTCETKWVRGENNQENTCCSLCSSYEICWDMLSKISAKRPGRISAGR